MDVTVLELNLPEASLSTPFSSGRRDDRSDDDRRAPPDADSDGGGRSGLAAIVVLVGLAALAWYLRSGRSGVGREADDVMAEGPA